MTTCKYATLTLVTNVANVWIYNPPFKKAMKGKH